MSATTPVPHPARRDGSSDAVPAPSASPGANLDDINPSYDSPTDADRDPDGPGTPAAPPTSPGPDPDDINTSSRTE